MSNAQLIDVHPTEPNSPVVKEKRVKKRFIIMCFMALAFVITGTFLSIYVDGLGVVFTIVFPFSALILALLIISIVMGVRKRKFVQNWYLYCLAILMVGLFLWTPLLRISRDKLDLAIRMNDRKSVVEDIKAGELQPKERWLAVPFEKYGRVSFAYTYNTNNRQENAVQVNSTPTNGLMVTFTTNGGFFSHKDLLIYVERPNFSSLNPQGAHQLSEHWFTSRQNFSFIKF